jgi:translation initiation factor 6
VKFSLGIYKYAFYKSPNIGIFAKCNDDILIIPFGFAETKSDKLMEYLDTKNVVHTSIAGTRLVGPMMVINNNGILVSSIASDEEIQILRQESGLNVERIKSKYTAIGNLIAVNDNGAVISPFIEETNKQVIQDVLGVPSEKMTVAGFIQVGSVVVATNSGAVIHPNASDKEIEYASDILKVDIDHATINGGIPFLSSGIIANSKSVVVGSMTSGPELIILSRIFKL